MKVYEAEEKINDYREDWRAMIEDTKQFKPIFAKKAEYLKQIAAITKQDERADLDFVEKTIEETIAAYEKFMVSWGKVLSESSFNGFRKAFDSLIEKDLLEFDPETPQEDSSDNWLSEVDAIVNYATFPMHFVMMVQRKLDNLKHVFSLWSEYPSSIEKEIRWLMSDIESIANYYDYGSFEKFSAFVDELNDFDLQEMVDSIEGIDYLPKQRTDYS